jgi:signal peptidase I
MAILTLLVLVAIIGAGWLKATLGPKIPRDTHEWTEFFHGYEAYLDRKIHRGVMQTTSMAPTINIGDSILWVEVDNKAELKVGDIIVFEHPTYAAHPLVAHRIVEIGVDGFWAQGDNAPDRDWVQEENVKGLVIGVVYTAPG